MLDKERKMLFDLNVMDAISDHFGGMGEMNKAMQGKDQMKHLRWLLTELLNEGSEDGEALLTEKQVGKLIHSGNLVEVSQAISAVIAKDGRGNQNLTDDDDEVKNATAGKSQ